MGEVKNNHVQMSKLLMKPFAYKTKEGKKVAYLSFKDAAIYEGKINTLGTLPEYYYDETEEFFGQEIEKDAGEVFAKWRQALKKDLEFRILDKDTQVVKRFIAYTFLRSVGLKNETKKNSVYLQLFIEKDQTQLVISTPEHVLKYIDYFFVTVLANRSSVNFVIPHNCVYTVPCFEEAYKGEFFWCMPISPKYGVVLIPDTQKEVYQDKNKIDGKRDVLGMWVGENESAKFWLGILNGLKNRGLDDILIACVDGLTGFTNAIEAVYPKTEIHPSNQEYHQVCVVQGH